MTNLQIAALIIGLIIVVVVAVIYTLVINWIKKKLHGISKATVERISKTANLSVQDQIALGKKAREMERSVFDGKK